MDTKICKDCKKEKNVDEFRPQRRVCKRCEADKQQSRRNENPELWRSINNKVYHAHREKYLLSQKNWRENRKWNPNQIYKAYKRDAEKRGYEFLLTESEIFDLTRAPCTYCGNYDRTASDGSGMVGIDRIDNSIGYKLSNCIPCCKICNLMRGKLTIVEFISKINAISMRLLETHNTINLFK